jgi:hypothetical protein
VAGTTGPGAGAAPPPPGRLARCSAPQVIDEHVVGDGEQPGAVAAAILVAIGEAQHPDEHFLGKVLGNVGAAEHAPKVGADGRPVGIRQDGGQVGCSHGRGHIIYNGGSGRIVAEDAPEGRRPPRRARRRPRRPQPASRREGGGPRGGRTHDQWIKSPLLYH